jgi:staphylopine/pseudopaline/yersinopine synthase
MNERVLIVGAGPVAFLFASLWRRLGVAVGLSSRRHASRRFALEAANPKFAPLAGEFELQHVNQLDGSWHQVLLAVPADQYAAASKALLQAHPGLRDASWILPSAPFGAHRQLPAVRETVSISSFFGASKRIDGQRFSVRGLKKRVYAGSSLGERALEPVRAVLQTAGVDMVAVRSPLEAEARNITTYVHPALFINSFALAQVLRFETSQASMYKLFPEGPITRDTMETMAALWREISCVLQGLDVQPINLLRFLNDDNYPVRPESVPPEVLEQFPTLSHVDQSFWLYVRYASLLVDPFSEPDPVSGRLHDFSAVPFPCVRRVSPTEVQLPRIPLEDYRTLLSYREEALRQNLPVPTIERLCSTFESAVAAFAAEHGVQC